MADKHIVVIGAGVVGLCSAYELVRRGLRVTVLDREEKPGSGCSYGNGGIIVPSHFVPLAAPGMMSMGLKMMRDPQSPFGLERVFDSQVLCWSARFMAASKKDHVARCAPILRDMNLASRALYEEMVPDLGADIGFARRGLLMLCRSKRAMDGEAHLAADANALGLTADVLDPAGLRQIDPGITMEAVGGVYFHDDAHLTPSVFMPALRDRLVALGVEIRQGVEVENLEVSDGRVASASGVAADEFVLAAGIWSTELAKSAGLRLPMLAGKGYGFTVANPPERLSVPSILVEGRVAVTPMNDGVRFVGTMELGPPNLRQNDNRVEGIRRSIPDYYPMFTQGSLQKSPIWTGLRPCSPDGMPYLGRPAKYQNLIVAAGHAMMGMSLGPISGKLVSELACGDQPSIPLALLSPDRYA